MSILTGCFPAETMTTTYAFEASPGAVRTNAHDDDKGGDDREKDEARVSRAQSKPAIFARLRQEIAERGSQRSG